MAAGGVLVGRGYVSIRPEFEGDWSRQASARASSAGKSASGSFAKAFGVGLKAIGGLAATAVAANLTGAAAAAAALAPALATAGTAAGALKLGLSGVGDAFKAAFDDSTADAKAAAAATKAVESAQRSLASAQRALADARVEAARRVRDAQEQVQDAERDLVDAQREARSVQAELNSARREAARALEDMNQRLAEAHLDEREAVLRLREAEEELKAAQAKPGTDPDELERLRIAHERATLNLEEQRRETKRLAADTKKANKAGVEGSEQVTAARDRIAKANRTVADRERALADAQRGVDEARAEGARQIADAQRGVAEAVAALADAQANAAATTSKLDEAMAKLSPNARSFVNAIRDIAPAWDEMRLGVQNALFAGLDTRVSGLAKTTMPILQRQLTATATIWNQMGRSALTAMQDMATSGRLEEILAGANRNLAAFQHVPGQMVHAFGQLTVAAQPAFERLMDQMAGGITRFTANIATSFASGGLQEGIETAFGILSQVGTLLGNVLGTVQQIFKAAADAGGQILGVLSDVFGELRRVLALPEVQAQLRTLFASVAQIVGALLPVVGAIVQAIVPLLAAIAPAVAAVATALGPVLSQLAQTLGAALLPVVQSLMPVVEQVGLALVQVVAAVTPLLMPISTLITSIVTALAPALTPIINMIVQLVQVLVGPLTTVITALTPALTLAAQVITQVFQELEPLLGPLVTLLGQVAAQLAGTFAMALSTVMTALQPLIPVGMELIRGVIAALVPVLPVVGQALQVLAGALAELLPPITEIVMELIGQFTPMFRELSPVLAEVARTLVTGLVQVLPVLVDVVVILLDALRPLFPVIGQIAGIMMRLGGEVLKALLPSLGQLVTSAVQLLVALVPILPPVARLIGLVVQLAAGVLSRLLPPLVQFAALLIGGLARALGVAIRWISSVISVTARLVGWVVDRLGPVFRWLYDTIIRPVFNAIGAVISWWWQNIVRRYFQFVTGILRKVGGVFKWLYDKAVKPALGWIADRAKWLYNKGIKPAFDWISDRINWVWENGIKPAFAWIRKGVDRVKDAFETAKDGIGKAWDKLKDIAKKPVKFIVNTVYNDGLRKVFNTVADFVGMDKLGPVRLPKGFKSGGAVFGPGTATSDSIPAMLSRGEHVWTAREVQRAGGHGTVMALRQMAKAGALPRFADGGIVDWISDKAKQVGSAVMSGVDFLANPGKLWDKAVSFVKDKIREIGSSRFAKMIANLPSRMLSGLKDAVLGRVAEQMGGGQWVKPVSAAFGTRFGVKGSRWASGRHTGLDFPAAIGAAVRAVAGGRVSRAASGGPYGMHVVVDHGGGLQSLYAHMSKILTKVGSQVSAGQRIGSVGATGNVTGPHLHLEARRGGRAVDPMPFFDGGGNIPGGRGVERWRSVVLQALGLVGQPKSLAGTTLRRMNQESGGDPRAVNRWDINWKRGHPSVGLMQVIRPTFERHAGRFRGKGPKLYGVSVDPLANVYSSMRYALAQYGSLSRAYNRPGGYDSGGLLMPGQLGYNGLSQPEAVLTPQQWRSISTLAARGIEGGGPATFEGDLYLDSGEFLGVVRGEMARRDSQLESVLRAGRR